MAKNKTIIILTIKDKAGAFAVNIDSKKNLIIEKYNDERISSKC